MTLAFSILCLVYLALMTAKALAARAYAARDRAVEVPPLAEGTLTVTQAILSGDAGLEATLGSNLISLPGQHFLWLCDEDDSDGIRIAEKLIAKHPARKITLLSCPPCPERWNPKVFKLILGIPGINTPYLLVLDDDTHLPAASAAALVHHAGSHDIATGLPQYTNTRGQPSLLLAQFVNNNSALTYLSLLTMAPPVSINGMCYVMRSGNAGLFETIAHHLTDDLALATAIQQRGGSIHQSSHPQVLSTTVTSMAHYRRMMHRWYLFALLLMKQQPIGYQTAIFLLHGWHPLILWALLVMIVCHPSALLLGILGGFLLMRSLVLLGLQSSVFGESLHRPFTSLLSEFLQPLHLVHALMSRNINWRGRRYRVDASDRFESHE